MGGAADATGQLAQQGPKHATHLHQLAELRGPGRQDGGHVGGAVLAQALWHVGQPSLEHRLQQCSSAAVQVLVLVLVPQLNAQG